jgi:hypothetical protein
LFLIGWLNKNRCSTLNIPTQSPLKWVQDLFPGRKAAEMWR